MSAFAAKPIVPLEVIVPPDNPVPAVMLVTVPLFEGCTLLNTSASLSSVPPALLVQRKIVSAFVDPS